MNNPYPASPKQKALIAYLGHASPETATYKEAREFIDMAIENDAYRGLLDRWREDKLKLHPDIYSEEVESRKASRHISIFEYCESERETYYSIDPTYWPLKKLNLKACKKAVEWLDEGYAGWDLELFDSSQLMGINAKAIETYFVPAIANVAPDFIRKERSGNPNPVQSFEAKSSENPPPIPVQKTQAQKVKQTSYAPAKKKKKRGCLFWFMVIILVWFGWNFLAAILK
jgi:hypothetical protein